MNGKQLLAYFLLLATAAGAYYFFEVWRPDLKADEAAAARRIFALETGEISQVRILGDPPILLRRDSSGWEILEPVRCRADENEVEKLLDAIAGLEYERRLADGGDRPAFDLQPALIFVAGTAEYALQLGGINPAGNLRYAACNGRDEIFLIDAHRGYRLMRDLFTLRDKRLSGFARHEVETVDLQRAGFRIEVLRSPDGGWVLPGEGAPALKQDLLERLLFRIFAAEAVDFPQIDTESLGTEDVWLRIAGAGRAEEIRIWDRRASEGRILAVSSRMDLPVAVETILFEALPGNLHQLLDRSVVRVADSEVGRVVLQKDERRSEFIRQGGSFRCAGDSAQTGAVMHMISVLNEMEYDAELLDLPAEAVLAEQILLFPEQEKTPVFTVGLYTNYYIALNGRHYRVDETAFRRLTAATAELRATAGKKEVN